MAQATPPEEGATDAPSVDLKIESQGESQSEEKAPDSEVPADDGEQKDPPPQKPQSRGGKSGQQRGRHTTPGMHMMAQHWGPPTYGQRGTGDWNRSVSEVNLYITGLAATMTDDVLRAVFHEYGTIVSCKAIVDKLSGTCKGYGFVMFDKPAAAQRAVQAMRNSALQCSFAKESDNDRFRALQEFENTNLYMANIPAVWKEQDLAQMLGNHGSVVSTRILVDPRGMSRGVGFARMQTREECDAIIAHFGKDWVLPGCIQPLQVRYADTYQQKKRRNERAPRVGGMDMGAGAYKMMPGGPGGMMLMMGPGSTGMPMGVPSANWPMYAIPSAPYGNSDVSGSPASMQTLTSQMQNMSVGNHMMPMYAAPPGYYGQ